MAAYCQGCMKKLSGGGFCSTSYCKENKPPPKDPPAKVGKGTGQLRTVPGGTLKGNKSGGVLRGKRVPTGVDTGLVVNRGNVPPRAEHPGIAKAKARAEAHSAKSKPRRLIRDKKKARREANRAIGKKISEASYNKDNGLMETVEGTMVEVRTGFFGGKTYIVVKDPSSEIWEDD